MILTVFQYTTAIDGRDMAFPHVVNIRRAHVVRNDTRMSCGHRRDTLPSPSPFLENVKRLAALSSDMTYDLWGLFFPMRGIAYCLGICLDVHE